MGRPARRSSTALLVLLLAGGCFPEVAPAWLVVQPRVIGIRTRVVEAGPHSAPLADDPPDRVRAEFLPGDAIRLEALVMTPDGPLDARDDALWFQCGFFDNDCLAIFNEPGPLPECDRILPARPDTCLLGRTDQQPFSFADTDDPAWLESEGSSNIIFGHVAATEPDGDAEDCRRRLAAHASDGAPLWDCAFGVRRVLVGPRWPLNVALTSIGFPVEPLPEQVPPEVAAQEPDLRPEPRFLVSIEGGETTHLGPESEVEVEVGQRLSVRISLEPRDLQTYWGVDLDTLEFTEFEEEAAPAWGFAATRALDGEWAPQSGRFDWRVTAEDDAATIAFSSRSAYLRNEAWAWIHLRVAAD